MQGKLITSKSPETQRISVKSAETTEISVGTPVCFDMSGTDDGYTVKLPSSLGAAVSTGLFAGIVTEFAIGTDLPKAGLVQNFGLCNTVKLVRATRAASTDSFASAAALALGDQLIINTVANAMSRSGAGAASAVPGFCIMAETLASAASSASNATDTRLNVTTSIQAFLRAL